MLLEKQNKRKKVFRKCLIVILTIVLVLPMMSITVFAEEGDPERWPWPLDGIYDSVEEMFCSLIFNIFKGCFDLIDTVVQGATSELSKTPADYNSTMFETVENVVNGVMVPIGSIILAYVVLYEFIQALIDKNSFHDFDTSVFIRFIFKSCVGMWFLANCFVIVNALFDLGNWIVNGVTAHTETGGSLSAAIANFQAFLIPENVTLSTLLLILIPAGFLNIVSLVIYACVYVILIGRMVEIYIHMSVAPIPIATIANRDFGDTGKNYLKVIFAYALQAAFIMIAVSLYANLCSTTIAGKMKDLALPADGTMLDALATAGTINGNILYCIALGIVLLLTMFKSGNVAKSILNCH